MKKKIALVTGGFSGEAVISYKSATTIYNHLDKDIEIIFGDKISKVEQSENEVSVTFHSGKTRSFDLVVGADGLHSNVRNLVFGDEA